MTVIDHLRFSAVFREVEDEIEPLRRLPHQERYAARRKLARELGCRIGWSDIIRAIAFRRLGITP